MIVATAITSCGFVTWINWCDVNDNNGSCNSDYRLRFCNGDTINTNLMKNGVATAITACGFVTTFAINIIGCFCSWLQQRLPLAVL